MSEKILQLQKDLIALGYNPGKPDGIHGPKTQAAIAAYLGDRNLTQQDNARIHEEAEAARQQSSGVIDVRSVGGSPDLSNRKSKSRDFSQPAYIQIHQTDFWTGDRAETLSRIKTHLCVTTKAAYEIHPVEAIIVDNYSDFYHIEVSWVSESRKVVFEKGREYRREAGEWTAERELLLEKAIVHAVKAFRDRGVEPTIITHRQTYKYRLIDPDPEIAQATYRIAQKHGFKLDYDWVRGSGKSAAIWYPVGCGAL